MADPGGSSFRATGPRYAPAVAPTPESKLRDVSKAYEKLFLQQMVKSMRASVPESGFIRQNAAERLFREELDAEYLQSWSDKGGVGFADVIYDNLVEKFGPQLGIKPARQKPVGPLPLNEKSNFNGVTRVPSPTPKDISYRFDLVSGGGKSSSAEVLAPWSGRLLGGKNLGEDSQLLEIRHENGLKSRLTFRGRLERLIPGQELQAGERIGLLSPDARALFWTLGEAEAESLAPTVSE